MKLSPRQEPFRLSLGQRGEMMAWPYLTSNGYKILERNYRCPIGEIDIVAEKKGRLVFVEVKTRTDNAFGRPEESVHEVKQNKLLRLASYYMKEKKKTGVSADFAVVAVTLKKEGAPEIRLIENAISADESWQS